jgi:hypothetical protein
MIEAAVYRVKENVIEPRTSVPLAKDQEISIVRDVIYFGNSPYEIQYQKPLYDFIVNNPDKFEDVTRNWK